MLYRYGLGSLFKLDHFVKNLLINFKSIYRNLNSSGASYNSVADLLISMGPFSKNGESSEEMLKLTKVTLNDKLESLEINRNLIDELVTVATRLNYGQMPKDMHAFVGFVSLVGVDNDLWAVEGGNVKVLECALELSKAKVVKKEVEKVDASEKMIKVFLASDDPKEQVKSVDYDIVVIATPLTADKSNLTILPSSPEFPGSFHTTVATIVEGDLIPTGTTTNIYLSPNNFLASIERIYPVDYDPVKDSPPPSVYKLFSKRALTMTELSSFFTSIKSVKVTPWLAYPDFSVNMDLSSFVLSPGLFYTSKIEFAASAMEMSAIAAKNVANLAYKYWTGEDIVQQYKDGDIKKQEL